MPHPQLDRFQLKFKPLTARESKLRIEVDHVAPGTPPAAMPAESAALVAETAKRIRAAREAGAPVMMGFGAHTIKNGLGPVIIDLMERGWIQHLATNGAGIIHDWEFSFLGKSSEDVKAGVACGEFGMWQETGFHLNLAIALGAHDGLGYGEAVGRMIQTEEHHIPSREQLLAELAKVAANVGAASVPRLSELADKAASAADLLPILEKFELKPGRMPLEHRWKKFSVQAAAYRLGIPFTGHPMFGHDIIYEHPMNCGPAIGRAAQRDFLAFAANVAKLEAGGVYMSVGSAVMSPMIFEKSISMSQNLAVQAGRKLDKHFILVVDLAPSRWDWSQGEPPMNSPEYYLRYCKTFNRMGGTMRYLSSDNRDFLLALSAALV